MRNRAKCKLCDSIIESFHRYDFVRCKCGEIAIDGGPNIDCMRIIANDFKNFLRIDNDGNEIEVKVVESVKNTQNEEENEEENVRNPNKYEMLEMLDEITKSIQGLPQQAMITPITHYDFVSALLLISSIFRADCKDSI